MTKKRQNSRQSKIKITNYSFEIGLIIVVIIALVALSYRITSLWPKDLEGYNGAIFSQYAQNYNNYGFLATKFGQIGDSVPISPEKFKYYVDHPPSTAYHHPFLQPRESERFSFYASHPPLLSIIISLFFRILGQHEWVARLVPILFSLASVIIIYLLGKKLWSKAVGLMAAIAFTANPMFLYYGHMVDHEALVTFFILLCVLLYLKWLNGDNRYLWGLCATIFVAGLTGWPIYYLVALFGVHYLVFVGKKSYLAFTPGIAALASLTLFLLQVRWFGEEYIKILISSFFMHSNLAANQTPTEQISYGILFAKLSSWMQSLFTVPLLIAGVIGPLTALNTSYKKRDYFAISILISLFILATIHVLVFREAAWFHAYWTYYFLIPLSLSMGISLDFLGSFLPEKFAVSLAIVVVTLIVLLTVPEIENVYKTADYSSSRLGQIIATKTKPGDTVLISAPAQEFSLWPQIGYYSRCNVVGSINDVPSLKKALGLQNRATVMVASTNATNTDFQKYLCNNYLYSQEFNGTIIIFNLRK